MVRIDGWDMYLIKRKLMIISKDSLLFLFSLLFHLNFLTKGIATKQRFSVLVPLLPTVFTQVILR